MRGVNTPTSPRTRCTARTRSCSRCFDSPHSGCVFPPDFGAAVSEGSKLRDGEDCLSTNSGVRPPGAACGCSRRTSRAPTSTPTATPPTSTSSCSTARTGRTRISPVARAAIGKALLWRTPRRRHGDLCAQALRRRGARAHRALPRALPSRARAAHRRHARALRLQPARELPFDERDRRRERRGRRRQGARRHRARRPRRDELRSVDHRLRRERPLPPAVTTCGSTTRSRASNSCAYADPAAGRHSLQLEVTKRLYMDEGGVRPARRLRKTAADLMALVDELLGFCRARDDAMTFKQLLLVTWPPACRGGCRRGPGAAAGHRASSTDQSWCELAARSSRPRPASKGVAGAQGDRRGAGSTGRREREPEDRSVVGRHWRPVLQAAESGLLLPLPPGLHQRPARLVRCQYAMSGNMVGGFYTSAIGFGWKRGTAQEEGPLPKCWADLTDPKYRARSRPRTRQSGTALHHPGDGQPMERGRRVRVPKKAQERRAVHPQRHRHRQERGRARFGIGVSFIFGFENERQQASRWSGAPPCEGTSYEIGGIALVKGSRNP